MMGNWKELGNRDHNDQKHCKQREVKWQHLQEDHSNDKQGSYCDRHLLCLQLNQLLSMHCEGKRHPCILDISNQKNSGASITSSKIRKYVQCPTKIKRLIHMFSCREVKRYIKAANTCTECCWRAEMQRKVTPIEVTMFELINLVNSANFCYILRFKHQTYCFKTHD